MNFALKYRFLYVIVFVLCVLGVLTINKTSFSTQTLEETAAKIQLFSPVIGKLVSSGVDSTFLIELIKDESTKFDEQYVRIDVPFSQPQPPDTTGKKTSSKVYRGVVNNETVGKITSFIESHSKILEEAENKYKIDKEILASLLWVETRHGDYLGYHHVPSVYLCLALADQPEFIEYNMSRMKAKYKLSKKDYIQVKQRLIKRSETKAKWARNEIASLYKISRKMSFSIYELYGSYAGAFGIPQFLPSSYSKFAIDGDSDGTVNLFNFEDAIISCANYLNLHGFGPSETQKRKAIYSYNHSQKYVNTIMALTNRVKSTSVKSEKDTVIEAEEEAGNNLSE